MRLLRRTVGAALVAVLLIPISPAQASTSDTVRIEGGGWGHGVGMSQYGAYGYAREGWTFEEILSHYYTGSEKAVVGVDLPAPVPVWVNLLQERTGVRLFPRINPEFGSGVPVLVTRGEDTIEAGPNARIEVRVVDGQCSIEVGQGASLDPGPCTIDVEWDGWEEEPTTRVDVEQSFGIGSEVWADCRFVDWNVDPAAFRACSYSRGSLHIRPDNDTESFNVVVEVDVEEYALGISEMPYYWGTTANGGLEALKAQVVAAKSYAISRVVERGDPQARPWCWCHIYDSPVDQRYVGWGHGQEPRPESPWLTAVAETAGIVFVHPSELDAAGNPTPIDAFYFSSTFGHTESVVVGFGGEPRAYLVGVPDPWSADPSLNPYATWTKTFTLESLAAKLPGMDTVETAEITARSATGAATEILFHGTPEAKTFKTRNLRSILGLRSMQVTAIDAPPLDPPPEPQPMSVALHDSKTGIWHLRSGDETVDSFYYGNPLDVPFSGDWDCDGTTSLGLYRVSTGFLFLRNSNSQGIADVEIFYGNPDDLPVAGDWNGDGCQTVGIFRPSEATFYLRNANTQGIADIVVAFGEPSDVPLAGDWDGDGVDTVGVYRPATQMLFLTNSHGDPAVDVSFEYSGTLPGDQIIAGDWNGDGVDTVGVFRPTTTTFYLRDTFTQPGANIVFVMGEAHMNPVSGFWGL